jgi:AhpD family alkylhydroperoxidase
MSADKDVTDEAVVVERILEYIEQQSGFRPKPLKLMAKRKGALLKLMEYAKPVLHGGPLTPKESALVALSAVVARKSGPCIRSHAARAREAGASEDEIVQVPMIAGLLSNTTPLHIAYTAAGFSDE